MLRESRLFLLMHIKFKALYTAWNCCRTNEQETKLTNKSYSRSWSRQCATWPYTAIYFVDTVLREHSKNLYLCALHTKFEDGNLKNAGSSSRATRSGNAISFAPCSRHCLLRDQLRDHVIGVRHVRFATCICHVRFGTCVTSRAPPHAHPRTSMTWLRDMQVTIYGRMRHGLTHTFPWLWGLYIALCYSM